MPKYSIIIPVFNEEDTIPELHSRLEKVMNGAKESYEIIFVNDGSRDRTMEIIRELGKKNPNIKAIELSRNFGLQPAYSAGIDHATGEGVIIMDGDLQDPPEVIADLIAKWKEGYEVVYTIKTKRQEAFLKRLAFASFYRILNAISTVSMPLDAGSFCIMSQKVVQIMKSLPEKNRLISGIRAWVGFRQTGVPYERSARFVGSPRQTLWRLFKMALDGMFSFSVVPIRTATIVGLSISVLSFVLLLLSFIPSPLKQCFFQSGFTPGINVLCLFIGVQLLFVGVLGEYTHRIYEEVKGRPLYLIKEKFGFSETK